MSALALLVWIGMLVSLLAFFSLGWWLRGKFEKHIS